MFVAIERFRDSRRLAAVLCGLLAVTMLIARTGARAQSATAGEQAVRIEAIPDVIAADAVWRRAWHGTNNADGLAGLPDGSVLFAQEQPARIGRLDANDRYTVYLEHTRGVGSLSIDRSGRLWGVERSCTDPGRAAAAPPCTMPTAVARLTPTRSVLADAGGGRPLGRLNDLVAAADGGVYFTAGSAWYADREGRVTEFGQGLSTNGIILNAAEDRLFVTNSDTLVAFDIGADGLPVNRRHFASLGSGGGDGMTIDAADRLYVTSAAGVQVFARDGEYLGVIPTPRRPISAAFAGPGKRTLYVVGSGAALGPGGTEFTTPDGVRNNAKTIYRIDLLARGYAGRAK